MRLNIRAINKNEGNGKKQLLLIIDWSNIRNMPRVRDEQKFNQCKDSLLAIGEDLFINSSFNTVGLNDILKKSGIPKGSFYHYFDSKEDFGLLVIELYFQQRSEMLTRILSDDSLSDYEQLKSFFETQISHFDKIGYCQGCLMANLSQEIADVNENLRTRISDFSNRLIDQLAGCIENLDSNQLNLGHLSSIEAAQLLMNSWQGAIMKMKLEKSREPLEVFRKFFFA